MIVILSTATAIIIAWIIYNQYVDHTNRSRGLYS